MQILNIFVFYVFFRGFLLLTFVRGISAGINEFEISIKFCFFIPILIFFKKIFFGVIIALFAYFKYKCEKNRTFSNILQKVDSYFVPISIILRLIPIEIP
jgi:hypothetical protein